MKRVLKILRSLCPSNYNDSEIERDIGRKSSFFHTPLHSTFSLGEFPSEYRPPFGRKKTRMVWLPDGEKTSKISLFVLTDSRTWQTDRQTDGRTDRHRMPTYTALVHMHRAVKTVKFQTTCKRVLRTYWQHVWKIASTWLTQNSRILRYRLSNFLIKRRHFFRIQSRGGSPIGAGGVMTPTFRGKGGRGGHNLGIIHISHIALITPLH